MGNKGYELFLLMFNLSCLNSPENLLSLFSGGIKEIFNPEEIRFSDKKDDLDGIVFELKARGKHSGYIAIKWANEDYEEGSVLLIRNAVQMLSVYLEKLDMKENLENEKRYLESLAAEKINDLSRAVRELEETRSAALNVIEDLNIEIGRRKAAEESLRVTERYFRFLIENAPDGIVLISKEGQMTYASPKAREIFGFYDEQADKLDPAQLTHPDDLPMVLEKLAGVIADPQYKPTIVYRFRTKEGNWKWIESTFSNNLGEEGINSIIINFRDISEKKTIEDSLRNSEEKFRNLFEYSPIGKSLTRINGGLNVNRKFCEILGYTETELKNRTWKEISHPDDIEMTDEIVRSLIEGKISESRFEKRYIHKDGSIIYAEVSTYMQRSKEGNPEYFITTINNITKNKELEAEKFRLLNIIEKSLNEIFIFRSDNLLFEYVNRGALKNLGYSSGDMLKMTPLDIKPLFSRRSFLEMLKPLSDSRSEFLLFETIHQRKDRSTYPVEVLLQYYNEAGTGLFFAFINDITERKKAEQEVIENEEKYRRMFIDNPQPMWIYDLETLGFLEVNDAAVNHYGYSREEFWSMTLKDIRPSEDIPLLLEDVKRTVHNLNSGGRWRHLKKNGELIEVEINSHSVNFKGRKARHVLINDITLRIKAEEEIRKINEELETRVMQRTEQLEALNKELEAFSYSVSHDLRAPLRAIHSFTSILKEDYSASLGEEGNRICGIIESSSIRMGNLIDDLLAFSRSGRVNMSIVRINLNNLLQSVIDEFSTNRQLSNINISVQKLPVIYGDPSLIKQVLSNLLSNAIKYTSRVEKPEVFIGSEQSEGQTVIFFRDNGVGFDMQYRNKLFGVFQRLHSSREFEGNGVGLAIVKRIIERHGGRVWAESAPSAGATFYFSVTDKKYHITSVE